MPLVWLAITALFAAAAAAESGAYPEPHALLLEAEQASEGLSRVLDKQDPIEEIARLFARAGYLDDARRAASKRSLGPTLLIKAQLLYGDLDGALNAIRALPDVRQRSSWLDTAGFMLWKMGNRLNATLVLAEAERTARAIDDPLQRTQQQKLIQISQSALAGDSPIPLSPKPQPVAKGNPILEQALPRFPISVDGFRGRHPDEIKRAAKANESYLVTLYAMVGAQDRQGLARLAAAASSPRQKLLGIASLEHLLIQVGVPDGAEEAARSITGDADITLAKAEALAAAARAWARARDLDNAVRCFDDAVETLKGVAAPALALGKVKVAASIAVLQAESRLMGASSQTFALALALAPKVEPRPNGPIRDYYREYRPDGYRALFQAAIQASNDEVAHKAADAWGLGAESAYAADLWLGAGRPQEALASARGLKDARKKAMALVSAAREMLDEAGAPHI